MICLFRQPQSGEQLVIGADPAEGGDYCAWVALSKKTADIVITGRSKEESPQLGHELNHAGRWIEKRTGIFPTIAVEKNTGSAAIYVLKTLNYPALFQMPGSFASSDPSQSVDYGWLTSSATRPKMLDDLALAVRQQAVKIPDKRIVDELFSFIRNAKTGKPEADRGSHDDLVIALAICWQLYQVVPPPVDSTWDQAGWDAKEFEEERRINKMFPI